MLRRRKFQVIYPEYFDKNRSRKQGRRVPLKLADEDPTLKKITKACEILKYDVTVEAEKSFPSNWWNKNGRLLLKINKANKPVKQQVVYDIAKILPRLVRKKKEIPANKRKIAATAKKTASYKKKKRKK